MSFQSRRLLSIAALAVFGVIAADCAWAQRGGDGGAVRGNRGFNLWGGGGTLGLLNSEKVKEELELVDDQLEQLREIQEASRQSVRDIFSEMRGVPREERGEMMREIQEKMAKRTKEYEEQIDDILLPHQQSRLKQLKFQSAGRGQGAGGSLSNQALLDELGVTDVQKEELEAAAAKAREKLQEKYQKLIREAENEILKVLSRDQREKYRELVGEPFQFENNRFGFQRGARRGERGRGGRGR